ncbi:MAG: nuclear transport factor 2 family protein [Pseudomonadota bacterium]
MRSALIAVTTTLIFLAVGQSFAAENPQDIADIKSTIQTAYVEGLQNEGDLEKIDQGFHPDFAMLGVGDDGSMWKLPIAKWKEGVAKEVEEGKLPTSDEEKVSVKFLSVDVTGAAAVAKFEFYIGDTLSYVDYMSLYKFGDDWKIVAKVFHQIKE